jgi:hypothetical protein
MGLTNSIDDLQKYIYCTEMYNKCTLDEKKKIISHKEKIQVQSQK